MSNQVTNVMTILKEAKPTELVEIDFVKDKFITLHNQLTGTNNGELMYHKEVFNYKKLLSETPALRECSPLSLYGCFLDINVNQLSLETGSQPDCYLTTRSFKIGTDNEGRDVYEKRAMLAISPYGQVKMRMRAGQIKYADNPIVVYDCDHFKVGLNDKGKLVVKEYDATLPKPDDAKIIACFVRVERPDGTFEMPFLDTKDIERLKSYSNKSNYGNANSDKSNALYKSNGGQIDTGFLKAKTLKHAFKSYPKVPTGKFSAIEPEDDIVTPNNDADIYGINPDDASANGIQDVDHEVVSPEDDEFDAALKENKETIAAEETVQFTEESFSDEPDFS